MRKTYIIIIFIFILATTFILYRKLWFNESLTEMKTGQASSFDAAPITPRYADLKSEYKGEEITSSTTLATLLKIENDGSAYLDAKFIRAYRYGNLIYASISTGEGGWYRVFFFKDGTYTKVAGGQDLPLCKSFEGYQVSKGLWCRLGGCFSDGVTITNNFNDCRL